MQKRVDISINLAKNKSESMIDRVIGFALTIGRILIIGTEIVALGAFLYRFSLDRTLVDLHDSITQEQAIIKLLHNNEVLFRGIQGRLQFASTLIKQSSQLPTYLTTIQGFATPDMSIHSIGVATDAIRVETTAQSVDSLTAFVDKIKKYAPIQKVSIDRINNQTETATITVNITAYLAQTKKAPVGAAADNAQGGAL